MLKTILSVCAVPVLVLASQAQAASPLAASAAVNTTNRSATSQKASFKPAGNAAGGLSGLGGLDARPAAGSADVLAFSAPPRESADEGRRIYQPVAEHLSRVTGKTIVYKHPGNWLTYQTEMLKGNYDLVFDGPHLNSWRISNLQHNTLVKIADEHVFAVVVRKGDAQIKDVKQLAGKKVCGMNPPNLGTLALLSQFDNPVRQPVILDTVGWNRAYEGMVLEERCSAAILPLAKLRMLDASSQLTRVIHRTRPLPNQALSAGPRVTREDQAKIAAALISPEANGPTAALRASNNSSQGFVAASKEEYAGLDSYLKDTWGYSR